MRIKSPAFVSRSFLRAGSWSAPGCGLCCLILLGGCLGLRAEENSPQPDSPEKYNLPGRAIPETSIQIPPPNPHSSYEPLFRLTIPYYDNLFAVPPPLPPYYLDPATYTTVIADGELRGLRPVEPENRLWTFHPFVGVQESYDSNIEQTPQNHIGDFSTILRTGFDYQLGSPDSVYSEGYDTILALDMHEEFWTELFDRHGEFNALNDTIQINGRIGRSVAVWRPFAFADDVTGSNLLTENRVGRVERQHLATGVRGDYQLSSQFSASQTISHEYFEHPDDAYIDFEMWKIYQEIDYRMLHEFNFFAWTQFLYTDVDKGADGKEYFGGIGWRGKPDPRLASEFRLGWDDVHLNQPQDDRFPLSGIHLFGHTSFEWSPRLRLVMIYDRDYTFNEIVVNDNYIDNIIQFVPEIYLGDNWYITPYFGVAYDQYETSHHETLELRPEIEIAYVTPDTSKIFVKFGYDHTSTVKGSDTGDIDIYRISTGIRWKF